MDENKVAFEISFENGEMTVISPKLFTYRKDGVEEKVLRCHLERIDIAELELIMHESGLYEQLLELSKRLGREMRG